MKSRGRSVPATALSTSSGSRSNNTTAITTAIVPSFSSISTIPSNGSVITRNDSKAMSQADVLARMTIELNVHAIMAQTERLEKSLSELMACTNEDKAFRESHGVRLQNMFQEILVVKQRMEEIQGPEWKGNGKDGPESCSKEVDESIESLRREMGELKGMVSDISSTLDKIPTVEEAEALVGRTQVSASTTVGREIQTRSKTKKSFSESNVAKSQVSTKQRIDDTIGSTRRWNRDHKTTKLGDATFIANYLRQQSKRDPPMALYIQRSILRHVNRSGRQRSKAQPKNLEQFCQDLVWRDVIETAEHVLVKNAARTMKALEERMSFS